ncbi:HAD family hydrolase [Natrarchaeobaculum sulfurireducens]|uniref:HAD superfamily hydrolase n=1 Tax=Natrarchaeobaculum sulfurireducens TaxID=2044521 RepID=A0A346PN18_9EURY|nr:HAD-IA family hydrolase [Natrarchaeobaculum sulfurireducens]AXR80913.1 hypothetical protein AArcMg_0892 [Natrarchaeobaculum sulfurireducens]
MQSPILFDMDGVILEGRRTDPQVYADATDAALAELGVEPSRAQRSDLGSSDLEAVADRCAELEVDPATFWAAKEGHASAGTHDRIRSGERGRYEDSDVIDELAERTTTALVSNNRHATAAFVADYYDFDFDAVRGRDPTFEGYRRRKPDPYYLERTLDALDADGGLYVGDSPKDVVAGRAAGLETAFVRRPHNRDCAVPEPTYELDSLWDLECVLE